ncbi:MAG: huazacin family RiPP peptide [Anaerorhabdus sp.]
MNQIEPRGFWLCFSGCGFGCLVCAADSALPVLDSISFSAAGKAASAI